MRVHLYQRKKNRKYADRERGTYSFFPLHRLQFSASGFFRVQNRGKVFDKAVLTRPAVRLIRLIIPLCQPCFIRQRADGGVSLCKAADKLGESVLRGCLHLVDIVPDRTGKKLEKWEREWYRKNRDLVDLPMKYSESEKALLEEWT